MTRFSALSAIFLTGAFITLLVNVSAPPERKTSRMDETELDDKTRERAVNYKCFKQALTQALDELAIGKCSLADARDRVYEAALHFNPSYLERIANSEKAATPQGRVARNLIGHINSLREVNPGMRQRVEALRCELAALEGAAH